MVHLTWRRQVFGSFQCAVYTIRGKMTAGIMAAFCSAGARQHAETLNGIDPGLITFRVAPFRWPLVNFHQHSNSFRRNRDIVSAKQKRSAASLNAPETYFTCEPFCSPLILLAVK